MGRVDDETLPAAGGDAAREGWSPGARLGRYVLRAPLGAGGMGVVWVAHDPELGRDVAVKLVGAHLSTQSTERLLREARALARLSHPNVVAVYDVGRAGDDVFVAMERVEGEPLGRWLEDKPVDQILAAFLAAGEGLGAAHDAGLVHRDFKPDNVIVGRDGRVRVLDFGLARLADDGLVDALGATSSAASSSGALTETGAVMGTPRYMAPEQFLGRPADAATDQFAFSVALWEALFGSPPFRGGTFEALRTEVLVGAPEPPTRVEPGTKALLPILERGLGRDPAGRHGSMRALLEALARAYEGAAPARRSRLPLALGALAGVALLASGGGIAYVSLRAPAVPYAPPTAAAPPPPAPPELVERPRLRTPARPHVRVAALDLARGETRPLLGLLGELLSRDVDVTFYKNRKALLDAAPETDLMIADGMALLGPASPLRPLAALVHMGDKGPTYRGVIVAPSDGRVRSLGVAALRDATVCFADQQSVAGHLVPAALLRARGILPNMTHVQFVGGHRPVVDALLAGRCDVGAFHEGELLAVPGGAGLRVLARTPPLPNAVVAATARLAAEDAAKLARALLRLEPGSAGLQALREGPLALDGFVAPDEAAHRNLARILRAPFPVRRYTSKDPRFHGADQIQ